MVVIARHAGYSLSEIDDMDPGYLVDLLTAQANMNKRAREAEKKPKVRKATQADFDAF